MLIDRWTVYANLIAELLWIFARKAFSTLQIADCTCVSRPCLSLARFFVREHFPAPSRHMRRYVSEAFCLLNWRKECVQHIVSVCSSFNCFCFASIHCAITSLFHHLARESIPFYLLPDAFALSHFLCGVCHSPASPSFGARSFCSFRCL